MGCALRASKCQVQVFVSVRLEIAPSTSQQGRVGSSSNRSTFRVAINCKPCSTEHTLTTALQSFVAHARRTRTRMCMEFGRRLVHEAGRGCGVKAPLPIRQFMVVSLACHKGNQETC